MARAQLHIHSEPTAVLALHGVAQEDAGTYRCRVDFKRSPTRYRKITLDVIGELHLHNTVCWGNFKHNCKNFQQDLSTRSMSCKKQVIRNTCKISRKMRNKQALVSAIRIKKHICWNILNISLYLDFLLFFVFKICHFRIKWKKRQKVWKTIKNLHK